MLGTSRAASKCRLANVSLRCSNTGHWMTCRHCTCIMVAWESMRWAMVSRARHPDSYTFHSTFYYHSLQWYASIYICISIQMICQLACLGCLLIGVSACSLLTNAFVLASKSEQQRDEMDSQSQQILVEARIRISSSQDLRMAAPSFPFHKTRRWRYAHVFREVNKLLSILASA